MVALDYADLMCREAHDKGLFSRFESHTDEDPFTLAINPKARLQEMDWIKAITFYVQQGGSTARVGEIRVWVPLGQSPPVCVLFPASDTPPINQVIYRP